MPLSDHEKRLLAEMEEALATDDPRLVSALNGGKLETKKLGISVLAIGVGIVILLGGLVAKATLIGVAGFAIALFGLVTLLSSISVKGPQIPRVGGRFEQRWDRRTGE